MKAKIISIGDELVLGSGLDTNSAWLAEQLTSSGVDVLCHLTVGDDQKAIEAALLESSRRADLVVATGGLGPTEDDRTRAALAEAMSQSLEFHADSWDQIQDFFRRLNRTVSPSNRLQAMLPKTSTALPNPAGTAPGIRARLGECELFAMPGVPREMRIMFEAYVRPYVRQLCGTRCGASRILHCFGVGEAQIGEQIASFMAAGRNPRVGTRAVEGVISIRIAAQAGSQDEAVDISDRDARRLRQLLGEAVFGESDDTLATIVGSLLRQLGRTVATAESCTGGMLGKFLTEAPGSSGYYRGGWVTYADEIKIRLLGVPADVIRTHGAVSGPTAEAMARRCREIAGTDYALSITGIAGPEGGSADKPVGLVYIGLASVDRTDVRECRFPAESGREGIRDRSCKMALDLLRRQLMKG